MYPHERSLVSKMKGQPFALIGVNSDKDKRKLKIRMKNENITWRSFWNGPQGTGGPISKAWGVRGWPTIYVLDHHGVIRYKNVRGASMDRAVDELVAKVDGTSGPAVTGSNSQSPKIRIWKDLTGQFSIEATYVRVSTDQVVLRRSDNKKLLFVPLAKLSAADQQYVKAQLAPATSPR